MLIIVLLLFLFLLLFIINDDDNDNHNDNNYTNNNSIKSAGRRAPWSRDQAPCLRLWARSRSRPRVAGLVSSGQQTSQAQAVAQSSGRAASRVRQALAGRSLRTLCPLRPLRPVQRRCPRSGNGAALSPLGLPFSLHAGHVARSAVIVRTTVVSSSVMPRTYAHVSRSHSHFASHNHTCHTVIHTISIVTIDVAPARSQLRTAINTTIDIIC